jgi:hypothetical protein
MMAGWARQRIQNVIPTEAFQFVIPTEGAERASGGIYGNPAETKN